MKRCTKCEEDKPLSEFNKDKAKLDGHRGICRKCSREYTRKHAEQHPEYYDAKNRRRKDARRARILEFKSGLVCSECGDDRIPVLEYHHLDPKLKEMSISDMFKWNRSDEDIQVEIDKCIILCASCHRLRHYEE